MPNPNSDYTMKIFWILCLAVSFTAVVFSDDEAPIDPQEAELERMAEQSPKQYLHKLVQYNREKLDAIYEAALDAAEDEQHREALVESQKAWLAFFESDSAVASWNAKGGSYAYPAQAQQKVYQLRLRMYQLSTPFMQGWQQVPRIANPKPVADTTQKSE